MKKIAKLMPLLLILFLPLLAYGQLNAPEAGVGSFGSAEVVSDSRCAALGHNTTLAPSGVTALFYNPGRLAMIPRIQSSVGIRARWGEAGNEFGDPFNTNLYQHRGSYSFHLKVNHLAVAVPIPPASGDLVVVLGGGYHTVWDLGFKQESEDLPHSEYGANWVSKGGYSTVSGGFALDYKHRMGVGAAYNIPMLSKHRIEGNDHVQEIEFDGSYALIGGYAKMATNLTMAMTWRQAIEFKNKVNIEQPSLNSSEEYQLNHPYVLSVGLEYRTSPEVAFMGEYQTRHFSQIEVITQNATVLDLFNDGDAMKFGIDLGGLSLGYYRESILVPEKLYGSVRKRPTSKTGFTVGIGGDEVHGSFEYNYWTAEADDFGSEWKEELFLIRLTVNQAFEHE